MAATRRTRDGGMRSLAIRFDDETLERLRHRAGEEGVGVTQLVRAWVVERLDTDLEVPAEAEEVLATLRRLLVHHRTAEATERRRAVKRAPGRAQGASGAAGEDKSRSRARRGLSEHPDPSRRKTSAGTQRPSAKGSEQLGFEVLT